MLPAVMRESAWLVKVSKRAVFQSKTTYRGMESAACSHESGSMARESIEKSSILSKNDPSSERECCQQP